MRAERADLESLDGKFQVIHRTRRGGKVQNVVHRARHVDVSRNVAPRDAKTRMLEEVSKVGIDSGNEIVQNQHIPAFANQTVRKVRPQKSSSPGDHRSHRSSPKMAAR